MDKRRCERRCDPNKCSSELVERRKADSERRRADEAMVIRQYYEEEARLYREAIQEWVTKVTNAAGAGVIL